MKSARGFTLLEVVVSVALFALAMGLAFGGLNALIRARDQLQQQAARWSELQFAVGLFERDVRSALPRPVRDSLGREQPALQIDAGRLSLSRGGHARGLADARAELLRVEWQLRADGVDQVLWRQPGSTLDGARPDPQQARQLLGALTRLRFEALGLDGRWSPRWPLPGQPTDRLPRALRLVLEADDLGRIERVFELAEGAQP